MIPLLRGFYVNSTASAAGTEEHSRLVKLITACKSRHEEQSVVDAELPRIKTALSSPSLSLAARSDWLLCLVQLQQLGCSTNFACAQALPLVSSPKRKLKQLGYTLARVLSEDEGELVLLLTNTLFKDLNSDSTDSKVVALTVLAHLDPSSVMQFVQIVEQLSTHPSLNVRAKAAAVLHRLYLARRDVPVSSLELVRKFLADEKYPIVSAGLRILETRSRQDLPKDALREFQPKVVSILRRAINGAFGSEYEYHGVNAPWLQVQCLSLLALTGASFASNDGENRLLDTLDLVLKKSGASDMVVIACCKALAAYALPHDVRSMLERKLESFVCGDDANLKFLGIEAAMETNVTTPAIVGTLGSLCQELKVDVSIRLKDSYEYWETKFKRAAQYAQDDPFLYAMREEERLALERRKRLIRQHGWIKGVYLSLFPQSERRAKELRFILIMVCGVVFLVSTHLYVIQQQQKLKRELLERRSNPGSSLTAEEEMWLARAGFPRQNPDMNSASFLGWSSRDGGGKPTQPDEDILPPLRGRTSSTYVPRKYEGRLPSQIPPASASMAGSKPIPPAALPPVTASDPPTPSPSSSVSKSA